MGGGSTGLSQAGRGRGAKVLVSSGYLRWWAGAWETGVPRAKRQGTLQWPLNCLNSVEWTSLRIPFHISLNS